MKSATRRRRKKGPARPRAPRAPKRPRKPRARTAKHRPDWRTAVNRDDLVTALGKVAGQLVANLTRAPLNSHEAVYLRGIANLASKKRLTTAQQLAVLAAKRAGSPLARVIFGKREAKLVDSFLKAQDRKARDTNPTFWKAIRLYLTRGYEVFYREKGKGGAIQRFSPRGFLRFVSNPVYAKKRSMVFGRGNFYFAIPDAKGDFPTNPSRRLRIPGLVN